MPAEPHAGSQVYPRTRNILVVTLLLLCSAALGTECRECLNSGNQGVGIRRAFIVPVATSIGRRNFPGSTGVYLNKEGEPLFTEGAAKRPPSLEPVAELLCLKRPSKKLKLNKDLKQARLDWATWEIRRFTYKLGTANKQMRKLVEKYNLMRNTFTCSREDLAEIRKAKREVSVKLRIASRLRRLFIVYRNGLTDNLEPNVPYVPLKYRSPSAPEEYYSLGTRKYNSSKRRRKLKLQRSAGPEQLSGEVEPEKCYQDLGDGEYPYGLQSEKGCYQDSGELQRVQPRGSGNNSSINPLRRGGTLSANKQQNRIANGSGSTGLMSSRTLSSQSTERSRKRDIENEILGIIADAKNQAIRKKRLVNDSAIAKIQSKLRRRGSRRLSIPKGL